MSETQITITNSVETQKNPDAKFPWYSPETGIYTSKHPNIQLPQNPFLDVVTHIFSYNNNYDASCIIDYSSGYSIPYSKLFSLVKSMSFSLNEMGFSQGDVALILLPNSVYFPIVLMGVLYLGGIVTPMNPLSSFSEVKHQILGCHARFAFSFGENVAKLRSLGLKVIEVPANLNPDDKTNQSCDFYRLVYGNVGKSVARPVINQDNTATIMYSSGTTGASKGVILTHRNLISMVELFVRFEASQYPEMSCQNVYLDVLPMFHIYGLALFGLGLLSLGTSVVVMRKFDINEVFQAIEKHKVTHFPVVPPIMAALSMKARSLTDGNGLSSLKQVSCGAASITTKVIGDFLHTFPNIDFIQGYGMTESTAVGTRGFNIENSQKHTSVGLLAPNMEAKVVNWTTGSCLPPGKAGELLLRGPGVMKGYLNNSEATRFTIEDDGWLHTGDIAYFDNDGYLYILDRLKEIIKYKGFQIAPADLESVLMSHPEILDAAVTGAADEEAGEIPVAFVIKNPNSILSRDDVINYVAKEVAPYKKVRQVIFVKSIPKSAAGKVLRRQLRNLLPSKL
ncbi:4-coumarate--CoA ligase-like 6 [Silene latifolia]|uniref:4-coumarate--CoA ligase-like 6 n=1 Tax=Silene latifolia TaxID=37657 RepID=UPI003D773BBB